MENLKQLRLEIDFIINSTHLLEKSAEATLAHRSLQRSKMWLGKTMLALGSASPYTESQNPKNNVIEPQAEHTTDSFLLDGTFKRLNGETERVKYFRQEIQKTADKMERMAFDAGTPEWLKHTLRDAMGAYKAMVYFQQSFLAIEESKMWLGMVLNEILKKQQAK